MPNRLLFFFSGILLTLLTTSNAQTITVERPDGAPPPAQMGISPPEINQSLQLEKGQALNKSIVLYNYNPKPKQVAITLIDTNQNRRPQTPNQEMLSPWTLLNPTAFTIPGNGQQTIRLSIRPPAGFPKKTHYAILQITQQVTDSIATTKEGVVLKFGSSYALPVTVNIE